jgi:HlyD family secretion protein
MTRYKNEGELAIPGQIIYDISAVDTVHADFFAPQPMLAELGSGQTVRIRIDHEEREDSSSFVPGVISWISDDAEFSPKNIQTRKSRNELVFRIRVRAGNRDNILKPGLPVEIWRTE